jgi:hypothetical protein
MEYIFEVTDKEGASRDTFTRWEELKKASKCFENGYSIQVFNSTNDALICALCTDDDVDEFIEARNRASQWKGTPKKLVDNNVKTVAAAGKPTLSAVPPVALIALGAAMQDGANKYGKFNWRTTAVTASVFYDALHRHLLDWYNGEDFAPDSKVHHLAHLMAGCAIILDAIAADVFRDDRDKTYPISVSRDTAHIWKATNA